MGHRREEGWDQGTFHGKWVKLGPEFIVFIQYHVLLTFDKKIFIFIDFI